MAMVTGFGGVFIKAADPKFLARWYEDNLGIGFGTALYFSFKWRELNKPGDISHTVFSFFRDDTTYFYPGTNDLMINFRVNDLDEMRINLKKSGFYVADKIESYEYGRFGWAMDPAGNKIELWEPIDDGFGERNQPMQLFSNVTGLGGVFIKCPEVKSLAEWYSANLGLFFTSSYHTFKWRELMKQETISENYFSLFPDSSEYFSPSKKNFMLNFRVQNLELLLDHLRSSEIPIIGKTEEYEYGRFAWIMDPEENKIELWEPAQ